MTEEGAPVGGHSSLRDVLRALDRDEYAHLPLPPFGSKRSEAPSAELRAAAASRLERLPARLAAAGEAGHDLDSGRPWWGETSFGAAAAAAFTFGLVAPAVVIALASSLVVGSPNAEWAVAALEKVTFDNVGTTDASRRPNSAGHPSVERVQSFASVWLQDIVSSAAGRPAPAAAPVRLSTKLAIETRPGETVALPIQVDTGGVQPQSRIVIRGVPEFVALDVAEPQPDGNWIVPVAAAGDIKLTAYALPHADVELRIELESPEGKVLASATTALKGSRKAVAASSATAASTPNAATPLSESMAPARSPDAGPENRPAVSGALDSGNRQVATAQTSARRAKQQSKSRPAGQMRAGLGGVGPQQRPAPEAVRPVAAATPKAPRIIIVDGPLPPAPAAAFAPAPSSPAGAKETPAWQRSWGRSALGD
jgi:hypothetical protein